MTKHCPECAKRGDVAKMRADLTQSLKEYPNHQIESLSPVWCCLLCGYTMSRRTFKTAKRKAREARTEETIKRLGYLGNRG